MAISDLPNYSYLPGPTSWPNFVKRHYIFEAAHKCLSSTIILSVPILLKWQKFCTKKLPSVLTRKGVSWKLGYFTFTFPKLGPFRRRT